MRKTLLFLMMITGFVLFMASCQYKYTIEPIVPAPDPTDTIYFSSQVVPVWNTGDKCTKCHNTGGTAPDLTPDNAYNAIISTYVDVNNPEASIIYAFPHPDTDTHNWGESYTTSEAAIILQWIEQGALNN